MRRRALGPAVVVLAVVGVACGAGSDDETTGAPGGYAALYRGLSDTSARAADVGAARRAFYDGPHQPLHELAAATSRVDRPAAARLLKAKGAVEADLNGGDGALAADLDRLLQATRRAITATGEPEPDPCKSHHEQSPPLIPFSVGHGLGPRPHHRSLQ